MMKNDVELGYTSSDLRKICQHINTIMDIKLDLISKEYHTIVGEVILSCVLKQCSLDDLNNDIAIPDELIEMKHGLFKILSIKAFDLKGGDRIGKQVSIIIMMMVIMSMMMMMMMMITMMIKMTIKMMIKMMMLLL